MSLVYGLVSTMIPCLASSVWCEQHGAVAKWLGFLWSTNLGDKKSIDTAAACAANRRVLSEMNQNTLSELVIELMRDGKVRIAGRATAPDQQMLAYGLMEIARDMLRDMAKNQVIQRPSGGDLQEFVRGG